MLSVAYLANQFPSPVEPYVAEEIAELRSRGVVVVPGTVREPRTKKCGDPPNRDKVVLRPLHLAVFFRACGLCLGRGYRLGDLLLRILFCGRESPWQRIKALAHTFLGACYAAQLKPRQIDHIHVHHGYFGAWIGLVASRLLGVNFSLTLHGSDLLVRGTYLDTKLENCRFCLTVSNYNRRYILERHSSVDPRKIMVSRLGVALPTEAGQGLRPLIRPRSEITLVAVGRLHKVKDHAFLLRACAQLHARGLRLECLIAGEGPERGRLESLIRKYGLENTVALLGHVTGEQMDSLYARADVVVLTSRSEGVPLVLMEAMARGKIVLAPAITGIPELVVAGRNGFLYQPGSQGDFIARVLLIHSLLRKHEPHGRTPLSAAKPLDWMRYAAQVHVRHNFNRQTNLESFADLFLQQVSARTESPSHENFVLQQI
jgi:colanic acid/amylovoran biosynthesis glycosyltransferase